MLQCSNAFLRDPIARAASKVDRAESAAAHQVGAAWSSTARKIDRVPSRPALRPPLLASNIGMSLLGFYQAHPENRRWWCLGK
jgi:hypothetical protein